MRRSSNRSGARVVATIVAANLIGAILAIAAPNVAMAQPPSGDYQFQNNFSGGAGTPNMEAVGPGTGFASEMVDGVSRTVFTFPKGSGLTLSPTTQLNSSGTYSIVMLFRFAEPAGSYRRLLAFKETGDRGLYTFGNLYFVKNDTSGGGTNIPANAWTQMVLTRDPSEKVTAYVNGVKQFEFPDTAGDATVPSARLGFFVDSDNGEEESAGAIARFRLFNYALTADQVSALDRLPGSGQSPSPSPTPTTQCPAPTPPSGTPGDYLFQDTLARTGGNGTPAMEAVGPGTGFATETVDGVSRRVFTFPKGSGLTLCPTTSLATGGTYSLVMLFRLNEVVDYRRLLAFKETGDYGLYVANSLYFVKNSVQGGGTPVPANTYVQVVVTRDPSENVAVYLNGAQKFAFNDATNEDATIPTGRLGFFVDSDNGLEESAGAIARFRLFPNALTADQVAALDRLPGSSPSLSPSPSPSPSTTPTTPSTTPTTTASPNPTVTVTVTTTPTSTSTSTPNPTSSPPPGGNKEVVVSDANDVAGPLDIQKVTMRKVTFFYSIKLVLFSLVKESKLRFKGGPGKAWVYLDTAPEQSGPRRPEYRVRVFYDGIDWGSETQRLSDGDIVGSDIADKVGPKALQFTFDANDVNLTQDKVFFFGETTFKSKKKKSKCKTLCRDDAPNLGFSSSGA